MRGKFLIAQDHPEVHGASDAIIYVKLEFGTSRFFN